MNHIYTNCLTVLSAWGDLELGRAAGEGKTRQDPILTPNTCCGSYGTTPKPRKGTQSHLAERINKWVKSSSAVLELFLAVLPVHDRQTWTSCVALPKASRAPSTTLNLAKCAISVVRPTGLSFVIVFPSLYFYNRVFCVSDRSSYF